MSSIDGLFADRNSWSSRASAALAGSSEGNGLSATAIRKRGMRTPAKRRENLRRGDVCRPLLDGGLLSRHKVPRKVAAVATKARIVKSRGDTRAGIAALNAAFGNRV